MVQTESDAMDMPDAVDGEESTCLIHTQDEITPVTAHFQPSTPTSFMLLNLTIP
jgi:hypothetical protein